MTDFPKRVRLYEVGPREGFQIESATIPTLDKVKFIDALSDTGVKDIQVTSFVHPKWVPQMADADEVVRLFTPRPGVKYYALALNPKGVERMTGWKHKLSIRSEGHTSIWASDEFSRRNNNRTQAELIQMLPVRVQAAKERGVKEATIAVATAFGCNFQGEIPLGEVIRLLDIQWNLWQEVGIPVTCVKLSDTLGWANPPQIKRYLDTIRNKYPGIGHFSLHLHDTRGLGMPNVYAALEMGVDDFDSSCGGLGGCPFGGSGNAAGNVCTEDVAHLCHELGIQIDIDLEKMIECAKMAEEIVGHTLSGHLYKGWPLPRTGTKWNAMYRARPFGPPAG